LQLLVRGRGGHQQAFAVAGGQAADDAGAGDGGVADGDYALEFGFEDAVREKRVCVSDLLCRLCWRKAKCACAVFSFTYL
jgi:hypothetical protein